MKTRSLMTLILVVGILVAALPAAAQTELPKVRVALILPGRADDVSWNQASFEGMNASV